MNLDEVIKNSIIQNQAPIGFDEFMQLALYYPKLRRVILLLPLKLRIYLDFVWLSSVPRY